jgi:hypothetical protein
VYIKLGGTVTGKYVLKAEGTGNGGITYTEGAKFLAEDYWGMHTPPKYTDDAATAAPAPGSYAAVQIKGLYDTQVGNRTMGLRQTNQAYRIYQYDRDFNDPDKGLLLTSVPTVPKKRPDGWEPVLWVPAANVADAPVQWILNKARVRNNESVFSFPIWDGGTETGLAPYTPRTSKIEITEYDDIYESYNNNTLPTPKDLGYQATFVVDYSAVTFAEPVTTTEE